MTNEPPRVAILLLDEMRPSPSSKHPWGAFYAEPGRGCALCVHWFPTRAAAVTYARAQHWRRYAIARFF